MDRFERMHRDTSQIARDSIGVISSIVSAIAPHTRIKTDDAVADWLKDVQTPGAPDDLEALAARGYREKGLAYDPTRRAVPGDSPPYSANAIASASEGRFIPPDPVG